MCFLLGKNQACNSILVLLPGCAGEGGTSQRDMAVLPGQPQPHPSPSCLLPPSPAAPPVLLQLTIPAGAHCWAEGAVTGWVARRRSGRQATGQLLWQRQQPIPHPRGVHTHPAAMTSWDMLPRVSQGWLLRSCSSGSHLWKCRRGCSGAACHPWHSQAGTSAPAAPPPDPGSEWHDVPLLAALGQGGKERFQQPGLSLGTLLQGKHWLLMGTVVTPLPRATSQSEL